MSPELASRRARLLDPLASAVAQHGFQPDASGGRFIRRAGEVSQHFLLVFNDARPGWIVRPQVGVRVENVEDILHRYSTIERRAQRTSTTVGGTVGELCAGGTTARDATVRPDDDPARAASSLIATFVDYAIPWFGRFVALTDVDALLNSDDPTQRSGTGPPILHRSRALILARLLGRADYSSLRQRYVRQITDVSGGFYLKTFMPLVEGLEHVPAVAD